MEYKKIENEIDNLLHNGGLNPYERKLLRKVKRKFCVDNDSYDSLHRLNCFMDSEMKRLEDEIRRLAICNLFIGIAVISNIVGYFLK